MHYRLLEMFDPNTRSYRTVGTYKLYPSHCKVPTISEADRTIIAAAELLDTIRVQIPTQADTKRQHLHVIEQLTEILNKAPPPRVDGQSAPRVGHGATTSTDKTSPRVVKQTKYVHQRRTRNNNPMLAITEEEIPINAVPVQVEPPTTERGKRANQREARKETRTPSPNPTAIPTITQDEDPPPYTHAPSCNSPRSAMFLSQEALHFVLGKAMLTDTPGQIPYYTEQNAQGEPIGIAEMANGVVHPITNETITKYQKLAEDPLLKDTWMRAMCIELGRLTQGYKDTKGTNTMRFLALNEIPGIPRDRVVTYARIVVDYRPQKADPNRVRITVGGNLIEYPYELTTRTADLTTSKVMWNSVISTPGSRYICADVKNFYLETPLDRYEYMRMPIKLIPQEFIDLYDLTTKVKNGYVYIEIQKGMYGLPQAGILANKLLKTRLADHDYYKVPHTPGLFTHKTRPIWFTLVVDDFGIKYTGKEHADHLLKVLRGHYSVEVDWNGALYCGITLNWNYTDRYVDISMPTTYKSS